MDSKKIVKRARKKELIQPAQSGNLSDREIEDVVSRLWEHMDSLPSHVQELLHASQDNTAEGYASFILAAGWALGKFDYICSNPWDVSAKSGWVSISGSVN